MEASPNVEGGHTEVGDTGGDPIIGLAALSNQLLIFKQHSIFRLLGDRPGNYIVEAVESRGELPVHTSIVPSGDALYYLTDGGLCCFNGVSAAPMPDARRIRNVLAAPRPRMHAGRSAGTSCILSSMRAETARLWNTT